MNRQKVWFLSDAYVPVTKRKHQGGDSVMICAGIVDQTIKEPINEGFKTEHCNLDFRN